MTALPRETLLARLREADPARREMLWYEADSVRRRTVGDEVHLRGLIEFSNVCVRDCAYCGLRAGNRGLRRYRMTRQEVLVAAEEARALGFGSVVLQSGEDPGVSVEWLAGVVRGIKDRTGLAVTLSVGERGAADYARWKDDGADRVLLKFETSDPDLYRRVHPPLRAGEPSRIEQLRALRGLGYEIGGGVMVGLPGQTYATLAQDLATFAALDLDMIGVGPYLPHPETPLATDPGAGADQVPATEAMTRVVIALARIACPEANLPATTALATADPRGYEKGLGAGANVIMPNLTPLAYRRLYEVYPDAVSRRTQDAHSNVLALLTRLRRPPAIGPGPRHRAS
jgi:biotin synthase